MFLQGEHKIDINFRICNLTVHRCIWMQHFDFASVHHDGVCLLDFASQPSSTV